MMPLGLFIVLEVFIVLNKTMDMAPMWLLIDISLFFVVLFSYFFDFWSEIPFYFWVLVVIWILFHALLIYKIIEQRKM